MNRQEKEELLKLLEEKERRQKTRRMLSYYPDEGPLRRELYPKHMAFFEAGRTFKERLFMAANRVGKTEGAGGLEFTYHLTGKYPTWWKGRKFNRPISAWAAGDTGKTVREIIQLKLFGKKHELGTGLIPQDDIIRVTAKSGVPDAIDTAEIRYVSGGVSTCGLKSFDQGRISFQGSEQDVIWLDEESPLDVYTECLLRTMTNNGLLMLTFTPLSGMSETVLQFLPGGEIQERAEGSKHVVMATWDDVPHLDEKTKATMLAAIPPFQRDARSKGVPQLGSGAIYPVAESDVIVPDMAIPDHWPRIYGMDVGWNRTAVIWGAKNPDTDVIYLYGEHYRGQAEPSIHAQAIKDRGAWIPGEIDPAARGRSQHDGSQLAQKYTDLGLKVNYANNAVEAGILEVWQRLSTGRLKVFGSLVSWRQEFRLYRRDDKGRIVKENDHIMDAMRYLVMGIANAKTKPADKPKQQSYEFGDGGYGNGWMG